MGLDLIIKFLFLTFLVSGVLIFFLKKALFDTTQGAVNRLNRETQEVQKKQAELNEKIKQAGEELNKRRAEADALVAKMKTDAEEKAKEERDKIVKRARQEGEDIIAKAEKRKEDIRKVLEQEMELKAIDFSMLLLEETFSQRVRSSLDNDLILEFLDSLEKVDMDMISDDVQTAEITSIAPLTEQLKTRLIGILKKKFNRDIQVSATEDTSILAGVILKFGTLTLDGSLLNMLKEKGVEVKEKVEKGLLGKEKEKKEPVKTEEKKTEPTNPKA